MRQLTKEEIQSKQVSGARRTTDEEDKHFLAQLFLPIWFW